VGENSPFETIMVGYNFLATEPAENLLPLCKKKNIGTIIMKPFGGGAFSNPHTALKFVLANKNANCTIPGMLSVQEVEKNITVCGGDLKLTPEELQTIILDKSILGNQFCAACEYCQPCPVGIPISFVLRTELSTLRRMGWTENMVKQTKETAPKVAACLQCGACETRCPYKLQIRELLPVKMNALLKRLEDKSIP